MSNSKSNNITTVIITIILLLFFSIAVFIVTNVLSADPLKNKLIHIDSKVVGSRWVFYEQK